MHTKSNHTGVQSDGLEEASDNLLLLNELDVRKRVLSQGDSLVETLIKTVRDIDDGDDNTFESLIEMVTSLHDEFEISTTSNDDTLDVWPIIGDEILSSKLAALDDVEMALLLSQTSKTYSGLTTATVLLWKLNRHTLDDLLVVTLKGGEHDTSTINDDEAELLIILQEGEQWLGVETVLALVGKDVDSAEGLNGILYLSLGLAILHEDDTAEDAEAIGRGVLVKLQLLTSRCNSRNNRLARLTRLNRFGAGQLLSQ